jgi:uncharacterized protein (TIGR03435 family)
VDETGIEGVFEFDWRWTPEGGSPEFNQRLLDPGFFATMRHDAGLRLELRRMPQEIMVIDRIGKTPNKN